MRKGSLTLYLSANSERLTKEMLKARKATSNFVNRSTKILNKYKFSIAALTTAFVAGTALMIKSSLSTGDNIQKLSIRLNESTEALSQYQHVAEITGVSFEDVANSFAKLQKGVADAQDGLSTSSLALKNLNLNVEDLISLRPSEQFETIADAIVKIEDPARRTQIAMSLMGRSGSRMLSTMAEGGEGIRKLRKEYDAMGGTLSRVDANQIAEANDAITRIGATARITGQLLAVTFAASIEQLGNKIKDAIPKLKKFLILMGVEFAKTASEIELEMSALASSIGNDEDFLLTMQALQSFGFVKDGNGKPITEVIENVNQSIIRQSQDMKQLNDAWVKLRGVTTSSFGDEDGANALASSELKIQALEKSFLTEKELITDTFQSKLKLVDSDVKNTKRAERLKLQIGQEFAEKHLSLIAANIEKENSIVQQGVDSVAASELKIQDLERSLLTEDQLIDDSFQRRLDIINNNVKDTKRAERLKLQIGQEFAEKHFNIVRNKAQKETEIRQQGANDAASIGTNLSSIFKNQSRTAFKTFKGFAIAEATINSYGAYTKALEQGGIYGYLAAGAVLAAGLAKVHAIASMSPTGGGSVSAGIPSTPSPVVPGAETLNQNRSVRESEQNIYVNLIVSPDQQEQIVTNGFVRAVRSDALVVEDENGNRLSTYQAVA